MRLCTRIVLFTLLTTALPAARAGAAAALSFSRAGDDLTITAADAEAGIAYVRLVLDETRGVITGFYDLTAPAGDSWNYASPYGWGLGLFAPVSSGIRNGSWTYAAGEAVDGQTTFTYTLRRTWDDGASFAESTVTIGAPTTDGVVVASRTEYFYAVAATSSQKAGPSMDLHAGDEAQMNALYAATVQDSFDIDGTLWAQIEVLDTPEAAALGLAPGRTFRIAALNLTDGRVDFGGASAGVWADPYEVRSTVNGGIHDSYASKPPAGARFNIYTRLEINITGDAVVENLPPVAVAGDDQTVIDLENDGAHDVTLDGSASYDSDGAVMGYGWTEDGAPLAGGVSPTVSLPVGVHTITLTVADDQNDTASDTVVVTVVERTPRTFFVDQHHLDADDANDGTDEAAPLLTISAATARALSGDTIIVKEGVYRESVRFAASGRPDAPITLKAADGQRAVVSGADALTGWSPLGADEARGNPHYANIYFTDIPWVPWRVCEGDVALTPARTPNDGWWVLGEGTAGAQLVDPDHLAGPDAVDCVGATVFNRNLNPVGASTRTVTAFDPAAGVLTVEPALGDTDTPGVDLYYLYNKLEFIDQPGEWAAEDLGDGSWRIYLWTTDSAAPDAHAIEASRRNGYLVTWGDQRHIVIDGLEIRGGQLININDSYAVGSSGGGDAEIRNCTIHGNQYAGAALRSVSDVIVRNNLLFDNGYGVTVGYSDRVWVVHNEIARNSVDGLAVSHYSDDVRVEANYIHDHDLWGHPDNCQIYVFPTNVAFVDNLMINSGQGVMMEEITGVQFVNNVILGTGAYMVILGHGNCHDVTMRNNTLAFSGYGLLNNTSGLGRDYSNNIYYQGHANVLYSVTSDQNYVSDYNVFFHGPEIDGKILGWDGTWMTWDAYLAASGQDAHSVHADPMFANAPKLFQAMDSYDLPYFELNRAYLRNGVDGFDAGDHVEINFDGVVRVITASGGDEHGGFIEFAPALDEQLVTAGVVANWKDVDDFAIDLALAAGSPAVGAADDGGDCGSRIHVENFRAADFDGDGVRDIPAWPGNADEPPALPGDADGDGAVTIDDFVILKNNFGAAGATRGQGDFNGDGAVNIDDFIILKNNFGATAD